MEKIKAFFAEYEAQVKAIIEVIKNFIMGIFDQEVAPEFENIAK